MEVRGRSTAADEFDLYISDPALDAMRAAFSPLPATTPYAAEAIPTDAAVLLDSQTPARGVEEAQGCLI